MTKGLEVTSPVPNPVGGADLVGLFYRLSDNFTVNPSPGEEDESLDFFLPIGPWLNEAAYDNGDQRIMDLEKMYEINMTYVELAGPTVREDLYAKLKVLLEAEGKTVITITF